MVCWGEDFLELRCVKEIVDCDRKVFKGSLHLGKVGDLHLGKMSDVLAEDLCHEGSVFCDASGPAVLVDSRRLGEFFQQRRAVTCRTTVAARQGSQELGEAFGVQGGLPGGVPERVCDGAEVLPIFD